jgi:superfamily I DNA/RNA helicase
MQSDIFAQHKWCLRMITLTKEQESVCTVNSLDEVEHMSIIACAGSGKTITAVRRFIEIYKYLYKKECIALFSYSNIAVSTFYSEINKLLNLKSSSSVRISTFDSFLTEFIIRPHGNRAMQCTTPPFLITGSESFLEWPNYKVFANVKIRGQIKRIPFRIDELCLKPGNNKLDFYVKLENTPYVVEDSEALSKIFNLGKLGGYTHQLRSYWVLLILANEPRIIDIISHKFPHILIDEAQDIGFLHQDIIEKLSNKTKITLIGDPNQAIYDFAHADGSFLANFSAQHNCLSGNITENYRSINIITSLANKLSGTNSVSKQCSKYNFYGVFYQSYKQSTESEIPKSYASILTAEGYDPSQAAILCRSNDLVKKLLADTNFCGQGITKKFAESVIERDTNRDPIKSFNKFVKAIFLLMQDVPSEVPRKIYSSSWDTDTINLRRALWRFWRFPETGLPSSSLPAKTQWLYKLKTNLTSFLTSFATLSGLQVKNRWTSSIRSNELPDTPLYQGYTQHTIYHSHIRIDTVHKAKGESLDSILYVVTKSHLDALFDGTKTEEGRIGYVALTRARYLFILAIPENCVKTYAKKFTEFNIVALPHICTWSS